MLERYTKAFQFMQANEGGFSNHKQDKGGKTLYGVSSYYFPETYKQLETAQTDVERHEILFKFYYDNFWNKLYDQIRSERLAIRLFDVGVNLGVKTAIKTLQRASNVKSDGVFGQQTLHAVNLCDVYGDFIKELDDYYRSLPDFQTFGRGWISRLYREIS